MAAGLAYANSIHVPLLFDDEFAIGKNLSLHAWQTAFAPPAGGTVGGRPILNASFALNYALGGENLAGYHLINWLIHVLAGLAVWGIATRTLRATGRADSHWDGAGFFIALLWTLHPLQTESVTYLSQRAESLMGLFYLATLYAFLRGIASARPAGWWVLAVAACALGMGTKEVMVSAPLMVLLYDRTFVAGSFSGAWRARKALYLGLAATWIPLLLLVVSLGGNRGGSTGFGSGVGWGDYVLTQFLAIVHYVRLVLWPAPLVFEYGPVKISDPLTVVPAAALVLGLLVWTIAGLIRGKPWAFLGVWFFALLAPTSLVPGAIQMWSEHRMYLASLAVIAAVVVLGGEGMARLRSPVGRTLAGMAATLTAAALASVTFQRNHDYRSALSLWADTVAKRPAHALARYNLGNELSKNPATAGEAVAQYEAALHLNPRLPLVHYNLAVLLEAIPGRMSDALEHYRQATEIDPGYVAAHNNLGAALGRLGRASEAVVEFQAAQKLEPNSGAISRNLGTTLFMCGRFSDAADAYARALQLDPNDIEAERSLGLALQKLGREAEARTHLARAAQRAAAH